MSYHHNTERQDLIAEDLKPLVEKLSPLEQVRLAEMSHKLAAAQLNGPSNNYAPVLEDLANRDGLLMSFLDMSENHQHRSETDFSVICTSWLLPRPVSRPD